MSFNIEETQKILRQFGIKYTDQNIRLLLKEGELKGECASKRRGYRIEEDDLKVFLYKRIPALMHIEGKLHLNRMF